MCGKHSVLLALLSFIFLSACAQPKYETPGNSNPQGNMGQGSQEQKPSECALRFSTSKFCLAWKWEEMPTSSKAGTLVFKVYRSNVYDDTPVEMDFASMPNLVLWMPSMGHGSSPTTVTRLDVGTYCASNVFFIMPGEWEMRFQVKDGTTIQDEAVVAITL